MNAGALVLDGQSGAATQDSGSMIRPIRIPQGDAAERYEISLALLQNLLDHQRIGE